MNETETAPDVLFIHAATGRTQRAEVNSYVLPVLDVTMPTDFSPGQVYRIVVVAPGDAQGLAPIPFRTWEYDASGQEFVAAEDSTECVQVMFTKVHDGDGVYAYDEQWVTLK